MRRNIHRPRNVQSRETVRLNLHYGGAENYAALECSDPFRQYLQL